MVVAYDLGVPLDSLRYAVTALYAAGESDTSNHALVDAEIWFTPPQDLTAAVHGDTVRLEWSRPSPIHPDNALTLYRIFRAPDGEPFPDDPIAEAADSNATVMLEDLDVPVGDWRYAVSALYALGESGLSNEAEATIYDPASAGDLEEGWALRLRVAPNPFNPVTTIRYAPVRTGPLTMTVYDVTGARVRVLVREEVAHRGERAVVWDGRDGNGHPVASGTYFVRLRQGESALTRRIVMLK
ncbi:MAG: T9SS type A sorting domain-containing protein [Candidatus Eisenbacteria bacterium]|nr:T9SS type A sorting domain-containing protein [Candidatus Latescibacterota bacterium]MBD3300821.1 T9SS type A sorting domain-containing protein [Candidatus Eisenbacteria bacterium]